MAAETNNDYTLSRLVNSITHQFQRKVFGAFDWSLSNQQVRALHYILRHHEQGEAVYQKMLEAHFKIRAATASNIINLLEQGAYVKREASSTDGRYKQLVPLPKAVQLSSMIGAYLQEVDKYILQGIDSEELAQCMKVLQKVYANVETLDAEKIKAHLEVKDFLDTDS